MGDESLLKRISAGQRSALSLTAGDFFEDGRNGLVTGYSLGDGGVIAVQAGAGLPRIEAADTVSAFSVSTRFIDAGARPDFLQSADLNGDGHQDLVVGSRGGSGLHVLLGDGRGNFVLQAPLPVAGRITAVSVWKGKSGQTLLAAGVCGNGCSVNFYRADGTVFAIVPVSDEPSILIGGRVNGGNADDLLAGGSTTLSVIDGGSISSSKPRVDVLPISGALAAAGGAFVYDRRSMEQIAVLTSDGSVHILARTGLISTPPTVTSLAGRGQAMGVIDSVNPSTLAWSDVEILSGIAVPSGGSQALLLRTRMSGSGMDDLLAINVNGGGIVSIGHPIVSVPLAAGQLAGVSQVLPARVQTESLSSGVLRAAIPLRVSQDARFGLVMANGSEQPMIAKLSAYHTISVDSTADSAITPAQTTACQSSGATSGCTLRAAMHVVDIDASYNESHGTADTVNLIAPPSTPYTLSYSSSGTGADSNGNYNYHIEFNGPVNLIGTSGSPSVINANNLDKVFSINPGYTVTQTAMDIFMSNVTLENGNNRNVEEINHVATMADSLGGVIDFDTFKTGNITFVNCNFMNSVALYGPGGAVYVSDNILAQGNPHGNGTLEVDGGSFSGNRSSQRGGAVSTATTVTLGYVPIIINGVTFTNNYVNHAISTSDQSVQSGLGGAIEFERDQQTGQASSIQNSTFSGNYSTYTSGDDPSQGGAVYAASGLTITNSIFSGNSAQTAGGAVYMDALDYSPAISGSTFTTNMAPDPGAVAVIGPTVNGSLASTVQYNRFAGNIATNPLGRSGLGVGATGETDAEAAVTGTYNFWGCNAAAAGAGCDTASVDSADTNASGGQTALTLTPYAMVVAALSSSAPTPGTSITLTGGILKDSSNNSLSNVNAFTGVTGSSSVTSSGVTVTDPGGTVSATLTISEGGNPLAASSGATDLTANAASLSATPTASGSGTGTVVIDNATATANFSVTVLSPTISIAFGASTIPLSGTTTLTFTLANPNTGVSATSVAFSDTLPSGLVVGSTPGISNGCGGTLAATAGATSISLSGSTLNASANCSISVNVTGTTAGTKINTTGAVTSAGETTSGATSNSASLIVLAPVSITKAFGVSSISAGGSTTLTLTLSNPDTASQSAIAFTDSFPLGLTIATPNGLSGACGGTVSANAGSSSVSLSSGTLAAIANCTITVTVTDSTPGMITNMTGAVSSTQGGTGSPSNAATLTIVGTPAITLAAPTTANRGSLTTLAATFTTVAGAAPPTKSINFFAGSTLLGSGPLTSASSTTYTAMLQTSSLPAGPQSLTAVYPTGDPDYSTATSNMINAFVIANNVWIGNSNSTVSAYQATGTPFLTTPETGGGTGVAIDSTGNVWSLKTSANSLAKFTNTGTVTSAGYIGGGLSVPSSLAIDGAGVVWITNSNNSISVFANSGTPVSTAAYVGGTGSNLNAPTSISIDISGNLWIVNSGNNTVTEVLGAATPTVTPLATGVSNNTLGKTP